MYKKSRSCKIPCYLILLLVALFLLGCVSKTPNIQDHKQYREAVSSSDSSLVLGKITWIENGKLKPIGGGVFDFYIKPGLLRLEDRSRHFADLNSEGEFAWSLKPGKYVMFRLNYRDTWSGNYFFVPQVVFKVGESGEAYYIGTLSSEFTYERDLIGGMSGQTKFLILDESAKYIPIFEKRVGKGIQKSLMVHDKNIPRTIDTEPEFQILLQVINAIL